MKTRLALRLLLPMLFMLCACSSPQALVRTATIDTLKEEVKLEPIDSTVIRLGASIGLAFPVWYPPQMFNYIGGSVGYIINRRWVASVDVNASGTSVQFRPTYPNVQLLTTLNAGLSLHWFAFRDLFLVAVPSYQSMTIRESRTLVADPLIETRERFTVGLGIGVRLNDVVTLEFRHYPVLNARTYPQSDVQEYGLFQLRGGVLVGGIY